MQIEKQHSFGFLCVSNLFQSSPFVEIYFRRFLLNIKHFSAESIDYLSECDQLLVLIDG